MGPPHGHSWDPLQEIHGSEPNHWYASPKATSWRCRMVFREVDVVEVKEMLRLWVRGHGYKSIARLTQIDRKTVRRYIEAAVHAGLRQADGESQITDGLVGEVINAVRPARPRFVYALIFTAGSSRHLFVFLTFSQALASVIEGCEAAWAFFGGVFKVVIPDNMKAIVEEADPINARINAGFLDYAQARGFVVDPTRVRRPQDKPKVERAVAYGRSSFFAGEDFADLADAQARAVTWCRGDAGVRIHGTTARRPAEVFSAEELHLLLPEPDQPYDIPVFAEPKVHRDYHIEVARALYSVPC